MTALRTALQAFATADAASWHGLPQGVRLADVAEMASAHAAGTAPAGSAAIVLFDPDDRRRGETGEPPQEREWIPLDTEVYAGGLRLWLDDDRVLALEGIHPLDAHGEFRLAPDLGAAEATFDTLLGPLWLPDGERVYAGRGLAVRVNPDNGLLLGLVGFAPTTVADYRARLRPVQEPARPLRSTGVIA